MTPTTELSAIERANLASGEESLHVLRRRYQRGALDPVTRQVLDIIDPTWNASLFEKRWNDRLAAMVRWRAEHDGTWPRMTGAVGEEKVLGNWRKTQRFLPDLTDERRARLDAEIPGWDRNAEDAWTAMKDRVVAWHREHNRIPTSRSADPVERKYSAWMNTWRKNARQNLGEERRAALDRDLPGWNESRALRSLRMLDDYVTWTRVHGRPPGLTNDADQVERRTAAWLFTARARQHRLPPALIAELDRQLPDWRLSARELRARDSR